MTEERVTGPDSIRYCDCGNHTLRLDYIRTTQRADGVLELQYEHTPALCPVCLDEEKRSELLRVAS